MCFFLTSERSEEVPFFNEAFGPVAYTVPSVRGFLSPKLFKFFDLDDETLQKLVLGEARQNGFVVF